MATPINAPLTSEIWHLSIEDLLEPLTEMPRLGGAGPFVINLSASSAPLGQPASGFAPPEGAYVYQIQRMEDRRPRYRLRLGPFLTEDEADAVLARVRDSYPSALTATAESDDLKAITALKPKAPAPRPEEPRPAAPLPAVAVPSSVRPAAMRPAPTRTPAAVPAPPVTPAPRAASIPVLSDCVEPARRVAQPKVAAPLPVVVPRTSAPASAPAPAAATALPAAKPVPPTLRPPTAVVSADKLIAPNFEATQTLRPLTPAELQDAGARWYVIQLSLSQESFDPDSLPNLDIFNEYRLYSVAGIDQGRIMHALRLGFFTEEGAAAAVASYLGGFYEKPTVKRISVAERERFRDQRVEARKDIGATGRHAVIEITGERHIRDKVPRIATVTPLTAPAAVTQATAAPARRGR